MPNQDRDELLHLAGRALEVFCGPAGPGDWDGGDLQDALVEAGLLQPQEVIIPCGEVCNCLEYGGPGQGVCFRLTTLGYEARARLGHVQGSAECVTLKEPSQEHTVAQSAEQLEEYSRFKKYKQGLANKFVVTRTDGRDVPGQKHHGCFHFVLDVNHDPYSVAALTAYATACEGDYPQLAADIRLMLKERAS